MKNFNNKILEILFSLSKVTAATLNFKQLTNVIMELIINSFDAEVGAIIFLNTEKKKFYAVSSMGLSLEVLNSMYFKKSTLLDYVLKNKNTLLIKNANKNKNFHIKLDNKIYIKTLLISPIIIKNKEMGIIAIANKYKEKKINNFTNQDKILFEGIISNISVSLENSLLYEEIVNIKNFNQSIIDSVSIGVITTDNEFNITTFNRYAEFIFNFNAKNIIGKSIKEILINVEKKRKIIESLRTGENLLNMETNFVLPDNSTRVLNFSISVLQNINGKRIGYVITVDDITEKKYLELQVSRTEKLAALGELSAGIAHEIKNPLTAIKGFTQILPDKLDDKSFLEKFTKIMQTEVDRLNKIIEGLLEFARPTSKSNQNFNINKIINAVIDLLHFQFEKNNIKVKLMLKEVPDINCDPHQIEQVLVNIILNAIQSMENGGVVKIKTEALLKKSPAGIFIEYATVFISDTGKGIKKEDFSKLFNPFFTTKPKGTGLGLSISHRIITDNNGFIEVESELNKGTTFIIYLPTINNKKI